MSRPHGATSVLPLRPLSPGVLLAGALLSAGLAFGGPAEAAQLPTDGEGLYRIGCAGCHGADGQGVELSRVAFDTPLPDFRDCAFASREPDADWIAVAHQGGPVRAFDRVMPAFGEAFDEGQLQLIIDHIRTFCTDRSWPPGELNLPRPLFTEKAYPEDEAVWTTDVAVEGPATVTNELLYEKRFGPRSMFEVALPLVVGESGEDGPWSAGFGDVAVGLKHTLYHDGARGTVMAFGGEVILPIGAESHGRGTGVTRFEPYFAWGQMLGPDAFFHLQTGFDLSTNRERRQHEAFWRLAVGRTWTEGRWGRSWTPMLEVLGTRDLDDGASIEWAAVPQAQVSLNTRQHVLLNLGVYLPLDSADRRSTRLIAYVLWDWFDGGLFDGW